MTTQQLQHETFPRHVGIIMDGNGRWAKRRGLPRNMGHQQGADVFGRIARHANSIGISHLTVYAFSTENWNRPPGEVEGLMNLLRSYLKNMASYQDETMRVRILGDVAPLSPDLRESVAKLERDSAGKSGMNLNIALNYGGREEILRAVHLLARRFAAGEIEPDAVDEEVFSQFLYTAGMPEVDLVIRTSGEMRISNFLLWQCAYAEYVFCEKLWPDFTNRDFDDALREFSRRDRRRGGL